ncbi:uncharacterized protein PF11_0213-like [Aphidius gifuensis]|uniref:uncharacterized protein PF11_0213-like n=1 Tax=Aphidius gifuensis TaxID=684658 RepID=UPI001CDC11E0|nr:uncharacterized protein PF11_0213-like [Aphidius gifuensis]
MDPEDNCIGAWSIVLFVIGTFLTTIILIAVSTYFYRRWRRNKGRHLVLVTRPEIVEDAYAFDNPCFKDATTPGYNRSMERTQSVSFVETTTPTTAATTTTPSSKELPKWSSPWSLLASGANNKHENRRTLDDSILVPTATRVSVVSLRSRDFTGLGFNVCGNMLEGIFVKDLLHRGPASESGRIHPGDRIASVKISFRNMAYEDALTILSYASPYDVEIEVESGGSGSRPTTLLKKTVGPSPTRICHPLYRSQSIPEFSHYQKTSKRLFVNDPNETLNNTIINSTLKSTKSIKSTPDSHTLKKRHDEIQKLNHQKIGIKVLPSLDGTVHRIVDENEHNTNLERINSRKIINKITPTTVINENKHEKINEQHRKRENPFLKQNINGIDNTDNKNDTKNDIIIVPDDVPAEVHNAAMAARRNRKSSLEYLDQTKNIDDTIIDDDDDNNKNSFKNKRKAPAPPPDTSSSTTKEDNYKRDIETENCIESINDYTESLNKNIRDDTIANDAEKRRQRTDERLSQNEYTEFNNKNEDDVYRKAASLGDLSRYESKNTTTLERAQSLDMADTGSKKRKAPMPPDDIIELSEDLTKLDELDNRFDGRKLKKSNEWGTLEDALWDKSNDINNDLPIMKKIINDTLEKSKPVNEINNDSTTSTTTVDVDVNNDDDDDDCSIELFNLPLSKKLSKEFLEAEKMFNPDVDNALARIVNNGQVIKSMTPEEVELDFRQAKPQLSDNDDDDDSDDEIDKEAEKSYKRGIAFLDLNKKPFNNINGDKDNIYADMKEVYEKPIKKITVTHGCPGCEKRGDHNKHCIIKKQSKNNDDINTELPDKHNNNNNNISEYPKNNDNKINNDDIDLELPIKFNKTKNIETQNGDNHNVSNISVSSGENSEDSGLVGESGDYNDNVKTILPPEQSLSQINQNDKMNYITEIKVSSIDTTNKTIDNDENKIILDKQLNNEVTITSNGRRLSGKKPPVPPRRSDSTKSHFKGNTSDKQVVYVTEVKNQNDPIDITDKNTVNNDFENWIYKSDNKEQNPWGNGSSQSPQPVTNIVVTSGDQKQS